jgi:hypothetical protein
VYARFVDVIQKPRNHERIIKEQEIRVKMETSPLMSSRQLGQDLTRPVSMLSCEDHFRKIYVLNILNLPFSAYTGYCYADAE